MPNDRCLVLGASGFLGVHLSETLARAGVPVRAFSRTAPPTSVANIDWHLGDFHNPADLRSALNGCDSVYHLISSTTPASSNHAPSRDARENLLGTLQLLDLMRELGNPKIVFVSTGGAIYSATARVPSDETQPTEPISAYGIGKLAIEHYLALYHRLAGLSYSILRVANPFGERQAFGRSQGAIGVFLERALRGLPIEIFGDGEAVRDYVYIHDVIRALILARTYDGDQRIFNIGSGRGRSINEVLATIEAKLGFPIARRYLPSRAVDVPVSVLDITRAKSILGWQPDVKFEDGLHRTVDWIYAQYFAQPILRAA